MCFESSVTALSAALWRSEPIGKEGRAFIRASTASFKVVMPCCADPAIAEGTVAAPVPPGGPGGIPIGAPGGRPRPGSPGAAGAAPGIMGGNLVSSRIRSGARYGYGRRNQGFRLTCACRACADDVPWWDLL